MRTLDGPDGILAAVGTELGVSDWLVVDQVRIDTFAEATGDHQWIHTDPVRALSGPFGATIAHGYLTLSLIPVLAETTWQVAGVAMGVNYGTNKVRFVTPVKVGSRVRGRFVVDAADPVPGGLQLTVTVTVEIEGVDKPALVAQTLSRVYF